MNKENRGKGTCLRAQVLLVFFPIMTPSLNEDVPEIIEGEFIPYDENLEPVANQEEAAAFKENSVREEGECVMFQLSGH